MHSWNPRDFATDNYRTVDERPYGGGPGMVMLIDPVRDALNAARAADGKPVKVIYLESAGKAASRRKRFASLHAVIV